MTLCLAPRLRRAIAPVLGGLLLSGCVWQSDYDALDAKYKAAQQQIAAQNAEINKLIGAIKYTVNSDLLFPSGGYELSAAGSDIIVKMASQLLPTSRRLVVNGYTDNQPVGPGLAARGITSNQVLSQKRAETVAQLLISKGLPAAQVAARGHGDANPVASNATPAGRAQNRRVEITLVPN
jgi:chemotaxis protein MotB